MFKKIIHKNNLIIFIIFFFFLSFDRLYHSLSSNKYIYDRLYINHINAITLIKAKFSNNKKVFFYRQINFLTESVFVHKGSTDFDYYYGLEKSLLIYRVYNQNILRISYEAEKDLNLQNIKVDDICNNLINKRETNFDLKLINSKNSLGNYYFPIEKIVSENNNLNFSYLTVVNLSIVSNQDSLLFNLKDNQNNILSQAVINLKNHYTTYNKTLVNHAPTKNFTDKVFILDAGQDGDWTNQTFDNNKLRNLWVVVYSKENLNLFGEIIFNNINISPFYLNLAKITKMSCN